MANQVKFRALTASTYASESNKDNGTLYFLTDEGTLYKGATRFGVPKVFDAAPTSGAAKGDLLIADGAVKVYSGSTWTELKTSSQVTSDIIAGLSTASGDNEFVKSITTGADGKFTANVQILPVYSVGAGTSAGNIKVNDSDVAITGWDTLSGSVDANATAITNLEASVSTLETGLGTLTTDFSAAVSAFENKVEVLGSQIDDIETVVSVDSSGSTLVSASSAEFGSLKVSGSDIGDIIDAKISAIPAIGGSTVSGASNDVTVSVTTSGGIVTAVEVSAPDFGNTYVSKAAISTSIPAASEASDTKVASEKAVATAIAGLDNAMHFIGTASITKQDDGTITVTVSDDMAFTGQPGDIVIDATSGLEAICTGSGDSGSTWELIGDQTAYASAARVAGLETTVSGISTSVTNIETKLSSAVTTGSEITSTNENLVTAKAVYDALCWIEE